MEAFQKLTFYKLALNTKLYAIESSIKSLRKIRNILPALFKKLSSIILIKAVFKGRVKLNAYSSFILALCPVILTAIDLPLVFLTSSLKSVIRSYSVLNPISKVLFLNTNVPFEDEDSIAR